MTQLILAPLRGITTVQYRQAFVHHFDGLTSAIAPFIPTVHAKRIHPKLLHDILPEKNPELPLVPQLIGNRASDFIQMATVLFDLGYTEINLNMGCPHKPIRKKRRGAGLLPYPDFIDSFLHEICTQSPCKISVKIRLGISDSSDLFKLIPILNKHPLSEVIIHARTAEQMYTGSVDLNAFEEALKKITHPVCFNGDINTLDFFQELKSRFPQLNRFMLGRGLLQNPFLAEEIQSGTCTNPQEAITRLTAFHDELLQRYESRLQSDQPILGKMKEFWSHATPHLSNGHKLFKKIKKTQRLCTYRTLVAEKLEEAEWI